ncbi:MAG: PQQ-binding-like beta-propeller repeat protein [Tannerellaceae bacterium]|jgi:outer membrane protein assembly factor BamB|nr:PQQ-binding-like beta-propeller repeat protein [Tannerellaceae bacterium]
MKKSFILFLFSISVSIPAIVAQENSQWRGTARNGVYEETGLLKSWPPGGPQLLWNYDGLGEGHTSVAVANNKIYVTGMTDSTGYLYVFDLQGKLLHKKPYGLEWNTNYNGSRSTVHVNDGRLYLFSARGVLSCLNEQTLEKIWSKNILTDFDGNNLKFGMTESPLIVNDILYATPGGEKNNVVALNKKTGELIWSSPGTGKPSTYCSPQYIGHLETPLVVNAIDSCLVAFHAETGECLWVVDQKNPYGMSPNTPLAEGDKLFSATGGGIGSVLLQLTNGGRSVEKVWTHEMDNKMGGIVKWGDYVYGSGEKNRYWYCVDWKTGETKYKSNKIGVGNVIAADGMLYCYSDRGEMALVKATPDGFDVASKFSITLGTEQHWAHPVIYKGVLYVRHGNTLMAYKIS